MSLLIYMGQVIEPANACAMKVGQVHKQGALVIINHFEMGGSICCVSIILKPTVHEPPIE